MRSLCGGVSMPNHGIPQFIMPSLMASKAPCVTGGNSVSYLISVAVFILIHNFSCFLCVLYLASL